MMRVTFEEIGPRPDKAYHIEELIAVVMSRQLRNGETVGTGAGSAVARAACRLAQLRQAPDLTFVAGGSGAVNPYLEPLTASSCDYSNLDCEAVLTAADLLSSVASGRVDLFFYGGLQVDKFGNVNLSLLGNDPAHPKLRGPGSAALPFLSLVGRGIIFMTNHHPRSFVDKVDFRTAPGFLEGGESWHTAQIAGLVQGVGPVLVISNLAVLDFEEESKAMRLVSVHPGVTVEQVKAATGFELIIPEIVPTTLPPAQEELRILREIDSKGLL
ncbi:MAG: CoA synthetase [Chloroflexi bacterium]|nr:CoA synthetase [Chloroflexota bacterium]